MFHFITHYSSLIISAGFMIAAVAVVVRALSNATRQHDTELDLEAQAALCRALCFTEEPQTRPHRGQRQPIAPSQPHAPARRGDREAPAISARYALLQLEHVSAAKPMRLSL